MGVQGDAQGHFVLAVAETGVDDVVYDGFVLMVLVGVCLLAGLDVLFDAFIHEYLCELILGFCDVEEGL